MADGVGHSEPSQRTQRESEREMEKKKTLSGTRNVRKSEEDVDDRLGSLPDSILHHIFSFVDTKYAVQSCVLSKRWKHFWTSLPDLNFCCRLFMYLKHFEKFVVQVLSRRDGSNIRNFSFSRRGTASKWLINRVISYAVAHNVHQLSIHVNPNLHFELQSCLVTACQSLRILKLIYRGFVKKLPTSLISLHLENVSFLAENSHLDLFSSCPNLENLSLINCVSSVINISAPQLANLTISSGGWRVRDCKFVVRAPKLTSFNIEGYCPPALSADNLNFLDKVCIDVNLWENGNDQKRKVALGIVNVLRQLSSAKYVTLSLGTIEVLSMFPDLLEHQPSPFTNLKSLMLKASRGSKMATIPIHVMTYLNNGSPCARTLVVDFLKVKG